jgi:uncharacterized protein YeaO (DUF488 family)
VTSPTRFHLARVYDGPDAGVGQRILVDRLWPRGVSKEAAALDLWCKEIAPSTELRKWYAHVPERFDEFIARYRIELDDPAQRKVVDDLRDSIGAGPATLLTATKEISLSHLGTLAEILGSP